jgi:ATP-dependent helicase Lhr and Lhr-like helicase
MHLFLWRAAVTAVFGAALAMASLKTAVYDLGVSVSKVKDAELRPIVATLGQRHDRSWRRRRIRRQHRGKFREAVPDDLARGLWVQQSRMAVPRSRCLSLTT